MHVQWKRSYWALVLFLVAALAAGPVMAAKSKAPAAPKTPGKVAVVNGAVITQKDFDREVKAVTDRFASMGQPAKPEQMAELKEAVLNKMIETKLLFQKAQEEGFSVTDDAVAKEFAGIKAKFKTEDQLKQAMASTGLSEPELKSQLKQGMTIEKFLEQKFVEKVQVSDQDAKKFYDQNKEEFKQPEMVRARHILISVAPNADEKTKKAAREKIEAIKKQLAAGADFATLAKENSQCPSSAKGGDLGFFARGQMVPAFEKVAFALQPGKVSDVVETQFGYHLIKVEEKKPEGTVPFEEAKDRIAQFLKKEQVNDQIKTYLAELKSKAKIETFLPAAKPADKQAGKQPVKPAEKTAAKPAAK
ncbi:MAG: peptidylprolyl isomerase [Desulfobacteraceae bacterium]|nr:peptidylprolyl isomerase [Desulfobacteraceae bacterium]